MKVLSQSIRVHGALVLANSFFGMGAIVGTLGLSTMNPLSFTFLRVVFSGSLLLLVSFLFKSIIGRRHTVVPISQETEPFLIATTMEEYNYYTILQSGHGHYLEEYQQNYYQLFPQNYKDWKLFALLGFLVSIDLGAYIIGLHLAGPIVGSIWQPTIPILTAAISMGLRLETAKLGRILGVLVAFGGCVSMVLMNNENDHHRHHEPDDTDDMLQAQRSRGMFLLGNLLFLSAVLCDSSLVLLSKELLKVYPPLTVTTWCYLLSSPFLLVAVLASSTVPSWQAMICPDCHANNFWSIPNDALPALVYYILAMSMGAWGLILWANQYVTGTFVVGYSVLQPILSTMFVVLLLMSKWVPDCQEFLQDVVGHEGQQTLCLDQPGTGALAGMLGIFVGLALIVKTEPRRDESRHPHWEALKVLSVDADFMENHNVIYGSIVANGNESLLRP
ncbi:MAG: hypothetical protein SGBAC_005795 [Bacillariaceae sp.]